MVVNKVDLNLALSGLFWSLEDFVKLQYDVLSGM